MRKVLLVAGCGLLFLGGATLFSVAPETPTTVEGWAKVPFTRYWFAAQSQVTIADLKEQQATLLRDFKTGTVIDQFGQPVTGPVAEVVFHERMQALNAQLASLQK